MWMTSKIMRKLRRKRRLWRAYAEERYSRQDFRDYHAYQEVQKEIKKLIKKAKRKLERSLAKKAKKDPKKLCYYLKSKTSNRGSVGLLMGGMDWWLTARMMSSTPVCLSCQSWSNCSQ